MSLALKENWWRFVSEGSLPNCDDLPYEIIDSWQFCRESGVNPYDGVATCILEGDQLRQKIKENQLLIELAEKQIHQFRSLLKGWRFITILTDRDGYILLKNGDSTIKNEANEIHFKEGAKWVETEVGSNAIGLAQRFKKPFTLKGYEHFSRASQKYICAAAPILDENHQLLGIINISSLYSPINHHYVLAVVKLVADSISLDWRKKIQEDREFLARYDFQVDGYSVVCTSNEIICALSPNLFPLYQKYIGKPLTTLKEEVKVANTYIPITRENRIIGYHIPIKMRENEQSPIYFQGVKGTSLAFQKVLQDVKKVAQTDVAVHIFGETGTGKELIAEAIHQNSKRADGPFVKVNCGAIPKHLLESELFGYEAGAFTGASKNGYKGKLEQANGGTLFLDELGDMPLDMQVSLLRVLQQKELTRIGGTKVQKIDIRIITAANLDIRKLVKEQKIREDLFYRIYVYPITIPPLRERKEDIKALIYDFTLRKNWHPSWLNRLIKIFSEEKWPGNIRELHNALERCYILYSQIVPTDEELRALVSSLDVMPTNFLKSSYREQLERERIIAAMEKHHGNIPAIAKELNISRSTLYRKIKKHQL